MGRKKSDLAMLHAQRVAWFTATIVSLFIIQILANVPAPHHATANPQQQVLAYATNVSVGELGAKTNEARAANGLPALAIHTFLNNGAQAKAQHMAANNYWAHTAPDGTEPWAFFAQSGYNYNHAGENLAYGFDTSAEVVDAWMNSPGHRANMLGDYKDVGFGIVNSSNYQDGEYTIIVAFYGKQPESAPAPAPVQPAPQVAAQPAPAPTLAPEPSAPVPEPTAPPQAEPIAEQTPQQSTEPAPTEAPKRITNLENLLNGSASWPLYASLGVIAVSSTGFALTHRALIRRGWKYSAHFILVHPALDVALLAALIVALLSTTVGFIR